VVKHLTNPLNLFREWHASASESSTLSRPDAMCVSTVDPDGNPQARFVDLKAVRDDGVIFCTSFESPKAAHIAMNPRVALTIWWDHIGRQIRLLGTAHRIPDAEADEFFRARSREGQLATWAFDQSARMPENVSHAQILERVQQRFGSGIIPRPAHWGGYAVAPYRVEFLTFNTSRVHQRLLYERYDGEWTVSELQP
jgi:pyridoxamine 5'-phosphate oxidase